MKIRILILVMFVALTIQAQNFEVSEIKSATQTKAVYDTTLQSDARLQFLAETIIPAVQKHLSEELAKQKIAGSVIFEKETEVVFNEIIAAVQKYAQNFIVVNRVEVDPVQIEQEYNELNQRIEQLMNDPDVKLIEARSEFKAIQERQEKLSGYYKQITKDKKDEKKE